MTLKIHTLPLGMLETNCYVVVNDAGDAVIVDPGADPAVVAMFLKREKLTPHAILLTHAHFDHIGAVPGLVERFALPVVLAAGDGPLYHSPHNAMPPLLGPVANLPPTQATLPPNLPVGLAPELLPTPGHSPGGTSYHFAAAAVLFSGDVLFRASVGRHDLPGGDWDTLVRSIREVLYRLPPATTVYPGHGDPTTIAAEREGNPFVPAE